MKEQNDFKNLWGAVALEDWASVSFIEGRIANEEDVESGCAVFCIDNSEIHTHLEIQLPSLANQIDEGTGEKKLVIVIQGEKAGDQEIVGLRYFEGGNAVCMLHEIEFI